jgi:hypothetical protein
MADQRHCPACTGPLTKGYLMCEACCRHIKRCIGFGFTEATNTFCDFHPSRFWERQDGAA